MPTMLRVDAACYTEQTRLRIDAGLRGRGAWRRAGSRRGDNAEMGVIELG